MMKDLNEYKTKISLPDFLIDNYKFEPVEGSSACYPKLKSRDTGQTIVVKMNKNGNYTYFDIHDDTIKGKSILDFLQNELSQNGKLPSLYSIALILDNYIKSGQVVNPDNSRYYLTKSDSDLSLLLKEIEPLRDKSFLMSRGVSEEILGFRPFKDVFFERSFFKNEQVYKNTIVKMFNKSGVAGLSQRNFEFKGCLVSRYDSLAVSTPDKTRPIDIYFIGESMLDAVSHYEINNERLKDLNIVYFSSEGSLTAGQIELFQNSVNLVKPKNIISLFDKDIAGQGYNLKLFGNLIQEGRGEDISTEVNMNADDSFVSLDITMLKCIADNKREILSTEFFSESIKGEVELSVNEHGGNESWEIKFPKSYENVNAFVDKLQILRHANGNLSREVPLTNDFNDDLRALKGVHKDWKIEKVNGQLQGIPVGKKIEEKLLL